MRKQAGLVVLVFVFLFARHFSVAQQVAVNGGFHQDSTTIGQLIHYSLTARYPEAVTVLFPDSSFSFAPFEYVSRQYFTTRTSQGISYDSVVYKLRTFEIDPILWLSLPVVIPTGNDSLRFDAVRDTLYLIGQVKMLPADTTPLHQLPLKTNTDYQVVRLLFNYPVLVIVVASITLVAALVWIFLGKKIKRYFQIRRLRKDYTSFAQTFSGYISQVNRPISPQVAETSLALWKKYLEKLEHKPYTKLTTREMLTLHRDETLKYALQAIDKVIYGNQKHVDESLEQLGKIAEQRFLKKLEAVKHG